MLRHIIYIISSILVFFTGIIIYGVVRNLREISLKEAMHNKNIEEIINPTILVNRKNYTLSLYSDTVLVKKYNAVFGRNSSRIKTSKNDLVTPIGEYEICKIDTNYIYYKKMYLNYPNIKDAAEALKMGILSRDDFIKVSNNINKGKCSYEETPLGANIGIQGIGQYNIIFKNLPFVFNWTDGSIAISNEGVDELLSVIDIGTEVKIKN